MQAAYWTSDFRANSNTPNANHLLHLARFKLTGHVGPVTSLLHPASADTQFIHTLNHDSTITKCPFDWDHLVSGGADFTVRLWDLDPWRETGLDRVQDRRNRLLSDRLASCITPPTCLSVFHCHSSPCISLFIGPPTCAVLSSCAGNSRLNSCVGSVGSDGSVSIISLHEQRVLLSTSPPCKLSPSPVIALGWRVPEDLLLVVHADWGLEIWDIASGILDSYETDQTAKEFFEQAHFVVELRTPPPSFIRCVPPMSDHAAPVATDGIATCTFFGSANYSASAACHLGSNIWCVMHFIPY
ncbi:unnamed protein product [Dicrocoelium dendriticum]|nr:unnamed protein product [Dicrocoelium dendriticum]